MRVYQFRHIRAEGQSSGGFARTIRRLKRGLAVAVLFVAGIPAAAAPARPQGRQSSVEVVVTLKGPPLADAPSRLLAGRQGHRLDLHSAANQAYLGRLGAAQAVVAGRIRRAIPGASVHWRFSVVLNGLAVVVPRGKVARLLRVAGVARVWPNSVYRSQDARSQQVIGAPKLWGPTLSTAGQGVKIAVIDEGIDQTHPFFDPKGFSYPPGFPKGNSAYTTPKVIVARTFAPPGDQDPAATLPYTGLGEDDLHATHVAGIAAGNANTAVDGAPLSGIAPRAYLGNYKAMTLRTPSSGLNANAPELAAAIEAAVSDGMDIINLSLGEPEIDPSRDIVVQALNGAADAGVVPVVAAGNYFADLGHGSIDSPGNTPKAISVAASTGGEGSNTADRIASFSGGGPTPYSLQLKPDVTAPGEGILSSLPPGDWGQLSGTSMASPHVAGAAALLKQRHPDWTVAEIKSALVQTGAPVMSGGKEVPTTREGGGRIDLVRADDPLLFAEPVSLSFGLLRPSHSAQKRVALLQAPGGAGTWRVHAVIQEPDPGVQIVVPAHVTVPGQLTVRAVVGRKAHEQDITGFVVLGAPTSQRSSRIPFWFRVERPRLSLDPHLPLTRPGVYRATTVGAASHVDVYRYPDLTPKSVPVPVLLPGPEVVYRFRLTRPAANLGVAITRHDPGVTVQPRIVRGGDENRLAGYTALPLNFNDYRSDFFAVRPIAGVILPSPGTFDIVFDSPRGARRGAFTFRFWVGDTTPPSVRILSVGSEVVRLAVRDAGAGVDPTSMSATVDGHSRRIAYADGIAQISLSPLGSGKHVLVFRAADYQEAKNNEDVGPVLPNTRTLRTSIVVP